MHKDCGCYELLKVSDFEVPAEVSVKRSIGSISSEYAMRDSLSGINQELEINVRRG